ncbi:MAG: Gfo/Idh/MocA family oxidoreductase [bacterium]|nr:Gfo/Idh/MocA family oxidoreductase [bacterium]
MDQQNRRRFLKTTLVAGGAASLAATCRSVHSQTQASSNSANSEMHAAIVGCGGRGGAHIEEMLRASGVTITHICDIDQATGDKRASQIQEQQGKRPEFHTDMRRLWDEDKGIDVVTVATPNHWHALAGVWAMQAGKDAYIEKPVSHNIAEGSALVAAAKKYNRICQVGTQCRSSDAVIQAIAFLEEGGIGEVNFARGLCYKRRKSIGALGDYEIPSKVDFDLWSGPAQFTEPKLTRANFHYDWHWQRLYGNGDLGNQGPHQTDIARWGLGIDTHPQAIVSYGGRLGYQAERKDPEYVDAGDTANTEVTIYDYGDKCIVFETRGLSVDDSADEELNRLFNSTKGNKIGVVFYGTKGFLVQASYDLCLAYDQNYELIREFRTRDNLNELHFGNFLEACRNRDASSLTAGVREGHLSAGMSHLGNISYYLREDNYVSTSELAAELKKIKSLDDNLATLERTVAHLEQNGVDLDKYPLSLGAQLKFDPEKEIFIGSEEANSMLTRDYRDPYRCPAAADV